MALSGTALMLKSLGLDPEKMVADFEALTKALQQASQMLVAMNERIGALERQNYEILSEIESIKAAMPRNTEKDDDEQFRQLFGPERFREPEPEPEREREPERVAECSASEPQFGAGEIVSRETGA